MIVASPLQPIEDVMRGALDFFHTTFHLPWAWSIVALTVLVRILLVPLTVRQIHSMQNMQRHAPQMKEIQKRNKGDRQKMNEELMKFYKENQINPASSCLPLVAQLPVFLGLFYTLKHFSKHPPGGDLSWLGIVPSIAKHASSHWSGYLLLAIYAGSQILSTYLMGSTMDKTQRTILMIVPLLFITVVARFPAGLVLYWVTTNLWTVGQGVITRRLVPKPDAAKAAAAAPKRSSRTPAQAEKAEPKAQAKPAEPRRVKRKKQARR